jgi:hypothetical protein
LLNLDSTKRKYDFGECPKMSETDAIALPCDWYHKGTVGEDPAEMIEGQIKSLCCGRAIDNEYSRKKNVGDCQEIKR